MKTKSQSAALLAGALLLAFVSTSAHAAALGTAFTYQGRLDTATGAANGSYDFQFTLWTALSGPSQIGGTLGLAATPMSNGVFTVTLDFGSGAFGADARWLQIAVRTNGGGAYTTLIPRQAVRPSPQALYAPVAGSATTANTATIASGVAAGTVTSAGILDGSLVAADIGSGQVVKSLNTLKDNVTLAAGANVALTPVGQTLTLSSPADWHLAGNAGTVPGTDFLGTTDNQALELKVNRTRALRLEPAAAGVNVIAGDASNTAQSGAFASGVGAGAGNVIGTNASFAIISGGQNNRIEGHSSLSAPGSTISGGRTNVIEAYAYNATIGGGAENRIQYDADQATIAGGLGNWIGTNADRSTIGGGWANIISNSATHGIIPGGYLNTVGGSYAFAAGQRAKANHTGAFVWADTQSGDFLSTANNQFLVRAAGGVGINKNNPATALDVNGTVTASSFSGSGAGLTGILTGGLADNSVTSAKIVDNAVAAVDLASDANSLAKVSGGRATVNGDRIVLPSLGSIDTSTFTGLGFQYNASFGEGAIMSSFNDGYASLSFYTKQGPGFPVARQVIIDRFGGVAIDQQNTNNGAINNGAVTGAGLTFGTGSGEGIASKRTSGGNQYGLDFYTGYTPKLSITWGGSVGIGTTEPTDALLDVEGNARINDNNLYLRAGSDRNHGIGFRSTWDGPFVYGWNGGALGTSGPDMPALTWSYNGNVWVSNNLSVATLTIRGGADLAEPFPVRDTGVEPGEVMVIDDAHPGHLIRSAQPYDTRVAGVVSGAGGVKPGLELHQEGVLDQGEKIALTGRVYVKTDARQSPIRPGDLLTTSDLPGHAMKASDRDRAQGAILGKAMTALDRGTGLVLVLVTLQ